MLTPSAAEPEPHGTVSRMGSRDRNAIQLRFL
jgi:hypothetical protein